MLSINAYLVEGAMNWKFWKRSASNNDAVITTTVKLPGPKELPSQIGRFLVTHEKLDPDYVWNLNCVVRPIADHRGWFDFRVFSLSDAGNARVKVKNFTCLDDHPELILYKGRYNKDGQKPELDMTPPIQSAA